MYAKVSLSRHLSAGVEITRNGFICWLSLTIAWLETLSIKRTTVAPVWFKCASSKHNSIISSQFHFNYLSIRGIQLNSLNRTLITKEKRTQKNERNFFLFKGILFSFINFTYECKHWIFTFHFSHTTTVRFFIFSTIFNVHFCSFIISFVLSIYLHITNYRQIHFLILIVFFSFSFIKFVFLLRFSANRTTT